jgi:hypothetical protein
MTHKEWICREHWKGVRKDRKRVLFRLHREWKRKPTLRLLERELRVWNAIKREAIERALGL